MRRGTGTLYLMNDESTMTRKRFLNSSDSIDERLGYDHYWDIPANVIPGMWPPMHKFGYNGNVDQVPITINVAGDIVVPTAGRVHNIKSSDAADVGNCYVEGVLTSGQWNYETVDVNGTGGNDTVGVDGYLFIHRMEYLGHGVGNLTTNVGTITATAAAPDSTVTCTIAIAAGQSQVCQLLIPSLDFNGKTVHCALLSHFMGGFLKPPGSATDCVIQLWERANDGAWKAQEAIPTYSSGNSSGIHPFEPAKPLDPLTWLKLTGEAGANDNEVFGHFTIVIDSR